MVPLSTEHEQMMVEVGAVLDDAITQSGLSQREVAEKAGLHRDTVISVLKCGNMRLTTLVRLAAALGFEVRVYFTRRV